MRRTTLRKYKKRKTFKKHRGGSNFINELNIILDTGIQQGQKNEDIRENLYAFFKENEDDPMLQKKKGQDLNKVLNRLNKEKLTPSAPAYKTRKSKKGKYESYESYPRVYEKRFNRRTRKKKEFHDNRNDEVKDRCNNTQFKLTPHQQMLSNFINPHTPYNSILLFHGTGTGKTCTAVSIAENFKDQVKEYGQFIIICGRSIIENFKSNIFDKNKLTEGNIDYQCTGSTYYDETDLTKAKNVDSQYRAIQKKVEEYYDFNTYRQFAKPLHNKKTELTKPLYEKYIRDTFSNKLIIIDEVQALRSSGKGEKETQEDKEKKLITIVLPDIAKFSVNTKMVLLSATPMFDDATEYLWLLNLMRQNDNKPQLKKSDIFNKDNTLKDADTLRDASVGYVSYVRGEDPYNYPQRVYPKTNKYKGADLDFLGYRTVKDNNVDKLGLYCLDSQSPQRDVLLDYQKKEFVDKDRKGIMIHEEETLKQMSLIVYPDKRHGSAGLKSNFNQEKKQIKKFEGKDKSVTQYKYKDPKNPFLKLGKLHKYSVKFADIIDNILRFIESENGIIFVFCSEVIAGILPFCLALEQNGIERYDRTELLNKSGLEKIEKVKWKKGARTSAKYITIYGSESQSKRDNEIRDIKRLDNVNGEKIRVIIGSVTMSEGISLKWVRQIHVLDPWYNLNRIEQIIGRGIRFCSHKEYPQKDRNVLVFLHAIAPITDDKETRDSSDIYLYKDAWRKAIEIGKIEQLMKESAIDCNIHKKSNVLKGDRKYSKICSYSKDCDYKCYSDTLPDSKSKSKSKSGEDEPRLDRDTYIILHSKNRIKQCITIIKEFYKNSSSADFDNILELCKEDLNISKKELKEIVAYSLNQIVEGEVQIKNSNGFAGKIVHKDDFYVFEEIECSDDPLYYRKNKTLIRSDKNSMDISELK